MASDSTQSRSQGAQQPSRLRSLLQLPTPIRYLFDRTPLLTYPTNELPLRALAQYNPRTGSSGESSNVLYIFTTEEEAKRGSPSFNPGCLKLQVSRVQYRSLSYTSIAPDLQQLIRPLLLNRLYSNYMVSTSHAAPPQTTPRPPAHYPSSSP